MTTALEIKEQIESGKWWQECGNCRRRMHAGYLETSDGDEIPYTLTISTVLDALFCSRRCRLKAEKDDRQIAHRKRRTICLAVRVLGPSINIKSASGQSRSGWCKCDLEYPGYVEFRFPGGEYGCCGCPWCGQFGVAKADTEAWHKWRANQ